MSSGIGKDECLGAPEGYTGGELKFCAFPTKPGRRFCDRCQAIRVARYQQKIRRIQADLSLAHDELEALIYEGTL